MGEQNSSSFAVKLRECRIKAGMTQADVAKAAGCHILTVSKLEMGIQKPSWGMAVALAQAIGVKLDDFTGEPSEEIPPATRGRPKKRRGPTEPE